MGDTGRNSTANRAAEVWREHRGWVAALLHAHKPRGVEADDLMQEVAMTLVRHINTIDSPEKIGPWLRTVALNTARDAGRRQSVHQRTFSESPPSDAADARGGHADGDARERGRAALRIAESLPPDYRDPLLLSLRGLSYKQISAVLELPVTTIETRLFRARRMVREELAATDRLADLGDGAVQSDESYKFDAHKAAQTSRMTHE